MLAVYGPYALLVLAALACYTTFNWQLKYIASALVLGPLTLLRPGIAILGTVFAITLGNDVVTACVAVLSAAAVLAVEPLAGRLWYARTPPTEKAWHRHAPALLRDPGNRIVRP